jgi:hypothetical protein
MKDNDKTLKILEHIRGEFAMKRDNLTNRAAALTDPTMPHGSNNYIEAAQCHIRAEELNYMIHTIGLYHKFIKEGGRMP